MPDANQVTTLIVAGAILVLGLALVGGGALLWMGGQVGLGLAAGVVGLAVAAGALFFTLSPVVARRYEPDEGDAE